MGFESLGSFDLENGWGARHAADRRNILRLVMSEEPKYTDMSPPRRPLSILQNLTVDEIQKDPWKYRQLVKETAGCLKFCAAVARMQMRGGKYFALEAPRRRNPGTALSSWADAQLPPCTGRR